MKRFLSILLCLIMVLSLAACSKADPVVEEETTAAQVETIPETVAETEEATTEAETETVASEDYTKPVEVTEVDVEGIDCYTACGITYPKVFGKPRLTYEDLDRIKDSTDVLELSFEIETIPDLLLFYQFAKFEWRLGCENDDFKNMLKKRFGTPHNYVELAMYILAGDCDMKQITLSTANGQNYAMMMAEKDGMWYPFDMYSYSVDFQPDSYIYKFAKGDARELAEALRTSGLYAENHHYDLQDNWNEKVRRSEYEADNKFKVAEYSNEELTAFIETEPTLEEAAEKLHTVKDAVNFLKLKGFTRDRIGCIGKHVDDVEWRWEHSADYTYDQNKGGFGGIAALINKLVEGDYDDQGYGWITGNREFAYYKIGDAYCIADFSMMWSDNPEEVSFSRGYLGAYEDLEDLVEEYKGKLMRDRWDNESSPEYVCYMYVIEADGEDVPAVGIPSGSTMGNLIPDVYEDRTQILYERDEYKLEFVDFDHVANRPKEK